MRLGWRLECVTTVVISNFVNGAPPPFGADSGSCLSALHFCSCPDHFRPQLCVQAGRSCGRAPPPFGADSDSYLSAFPYAAFQIIFGHNFVYKPGTSVAECHPPFDANSVAYYSVFRICAFVCKPYPPLETI